MKIDRGLAVVGLVLSLVIAGFVIYLAMAQSTLNAKTDCWDHKVLDRAVTHHPSRSELITQARACAKLP